ncbi:substrate-binding domain-containing protein [Diplocloster modestus]|uniref:Substrate-binding domain-containing protein n=1 Tax=Diplocloster modestus TaxID=2850322 RepID=A0ABS6K8M4_9FIRM|nr:substrate-binding domain-containing protein [Diplocloster modestus]MBU9726865.1 substrate-binding domain-containing protein [Diplocloster modestus]
MPPDDYLSFVGSNDVEAGEIMGNYVDEKLGGSGNLVLLEGLMGESGQLYRREGLENTILAKDGYELLSELSAEWSRAKAMSITEDWLGKYPQIDAILCENDDMAMGALQAAESSERDPLIIGVDAIPDALQAVKDGRMDATILQDAQGQAQVSVDVAVKIVNGESVEKEYSVPFQLITSENVDQFMEP